MKKLRVFIDEEDVVLRDCLDSQIVEQPEKLSAMIGAVINHMQKHLPKDEIFVFSLCERPCEQHIVPQPRQITLSQWARIVCRSSN